MPKELRLIDLNLISGSTETTRTAFGGFYEVLSGSTGEYLSPVWYKYSPLWADQDTEGAHFKNAASTTNEELMTTISDEVIIPNKTVPMRFWPNYNNAILGSTNSANFWKTIWLGGKYGTSSYEPIWTEAVFDDHSFDYSLPYSQKESITIEGGSGFTDVAQITYDYNRYLREYQTYVNNLDSELLIPNMYLLKEYEQYLVDESTGASYVAAGDDATATEETAISLSSSIINFVTRENNALTTFDGTYFDSPSTAFDSKEVALDWNSLLLENDFASQYLTSSLLLYPLSASTTIEIKNILQNIMFDDEALDPDSTCPYNTIEDALPNSSVTFTDDTAATSTHSLTYKVKIPFYTTVNFDTARSTDTDYVDFITDNKFSQKFLKTLKEVFLEEISVTPETSTFAVENNYYKASEDSGSIAYYDTTETKNQTFRSVDYLKMLAYAHNNNFSTTNNCYFLGGQTFNRNSVFDKVGNYRHSNAEGTLGVINDTVDWLNNENNFDASNLWRLYNNIYPADSSAALGNSSKYRETLAYRIEKVGGPPTGDLQTQNVLQNFWFFNPSNISEINFNDSQVKYGSEYTYNVYAYVLVVGVKYNFSDLKLARQISDYEQADITYNCLQFYDPFTDEIADQIYKSWEDNPLNGSSIYATNALARTYAVTKHLADFNVNYEPNLKLIEIPMFSKGITILDHPPNSFDINPYQVNDNSQTIGFSINYETFYIASGDVAGMTYPTPISPADEITRGAYLNSRDILSSSYLDLESVSRQRTLEAYRLDKKPKSISDFNGSKIGSIDLKIPSSKYTYSNTDFHDKIKTNQKYYYLFRFLNEQGIPGQPSDIYEAELVDDGGYKYAVFNILFETELGEEVFINPLKPFKKLFQLQPNVSHLLLDTSEADFDNSAFDEIGNISVGSADDPIWDQTFKLRMTSKKTGKKIDFNITYKIAEQNEAT